MVVLRCVVEFNLEAIARVGTSTVTSTSTWSRQLITKPGENARGSVKVELTSLSRVPLFYIRMHMYVEYIQYSVP